MTAPDPLHDLLIAVPVVILACQGGARLLRGLGQPPVVGEIAVGILLGPSLLGWVWPGAQHWLFPDTVLPYIGVLGDLGLLAFMFLVGLELDLGALRGQSRTAIAVSQVSIALPLGLGCLLALGLFGRFAPDGVDRPAFVLFIGVSLSVTAFPVLARILTDRGLYGTPLGALAMACAAVDDVTAWCLLAAAVAVGGGSSGVLGTALFAAVFLAVMLGVVRPLLVRGTPRAERTGDGVVLVVLFSGLCLSALVTDLIGVHALFGAFVFGVVVPRGSRTVERCAGRLRAVTVPVLLPLFFVVTGLRTDLALLVGDPVLWLWALAVLVVAMAGKWGGGALAARAAGRPWPEALALGALMNCRGLTELVVLDVGLELGVIGRDLFTILVLMALLTTAVTSPSVRRLYRAAPAEDTGQGLPGGADLPPERPCGPVVTPTTGATTGIRP